MRACNRLGAIAAVSIAIGAQACGGDAASADNPPVDKSAEAPDPLRGKSTASRLLGTWRIDLSKIPEDALTPQFRTALKSGNGLPEGSTVDYVFTDNEMVLSMAGLGSADKRRWFYEILRQSGDNLELEREAPDGKKDKMAITVADNRLRIHTGHALIELERVR